ncbi:MAG: peptide chain release factor 2 [Ruthenibacterium sp.]
MVILDDVKRRLGELAPIVADLADALAIGPSKIRLDELENKSADPSFYEDASASGVVFAEMGELKDKLEDYEKLKSMLADAQTMLEMCEEDDDPALAEETADAVDELDTKVEELRLVTLLTGEYDHNNAILTFHAGAGGTEAQDWVEMLFRMYQRFAARHGFTVKTLDYLDGDEAGIKSASILVEGHNAYGFLRSENGVHRLVRISPFDSSGRRHTSFASLEVMPELDDSIVVDIRPEDIKMEVFRSSGAGGQHINKTSSAVRLIHLPTGIVVSCQNERSQFQNKDMCMKMLAAKLYQIKEREHLDKITDIKGVQNAIAWGSQIRSYVFMPYTLVKDHRTGYENGNVSAVMDGDIDGFLNAYLKAAGKGEV